MFNVSLPDFKPIFLPGIGSPEAIFTGIKINELFDEENVKSRKKRAHG